MQGDRVLNVDLFEEFWSKLIMRRKKSQAHQIHDENLEITREFFSRKFSTLEDPLELQRKNKHLD